MSDSEHEYLVAHEALRTEVVRLRALTRRALQTAIAAQDAATGRHDDWLDTEMLALERAEDERTEAERA